MALLYHHCMSLRLRRKPERRDPSALDARSIHLDCFSDPFWPCEIIHIRMGLSLRSAGPWWVAAKHVNLQHKIASPYRTTSYMLLLNSLQTAEIKPFPFIICCWQTNGPRCRLLSLFSFFLSLVIDTTFFRIWFRKHSPTGVSGHYRRNNCLSTAPFEFMQWPHCLCWVYNCHM